MEEEKTKVDAQREAVHWQTFAGTALQVPAAIAGVAFFFGTAALLGKVVAIPGLARQLSVTDVISEAIVVTPPFLFLWIGTVGFVGFVLDVSPQNETFRRYFRIGYLGSLVVLGVALAAAPMISIRLLTPFTMILCYLFLFFASATKIVVGHRDKPPMTFFVLVPILSTFVLIALTSLEVARRAREFPDKKILADGYEVCVDRCHPGIIVGSTSSLSAVRYWGSNQIYLIANADIKAQKMNIPLIDWEKPFLFWPWVSRDEVSSRP